MNSMNRTDRTDSDATAGRLSRDTEAVLLLCGVFGGRASGGVEPLTTREYNEVARWLAGKGLRPSALVDGIEPGGGGGEGGGEGGGGGGGEGGGGGGGGGEGEGGPLGIDADRVRQLLARGMAMSVALDLWRSSGIWVIGRTDPDYPRLWERRLKASRPPLLFGVGPRELLNAKAVAVVGSREVDEAGTAFAGEVARWCARESLVVASGGARGVDRTAMLAAIDAGGAATGILAGALGREAVSGWCREALRNGRLALVSPYGPDARFTVGGAMGRNRLIYCMADLAVVVSAAEGEGGTWAGATETLKHGWVPLAVRSGDGIPAGNRALLAKGAIEFSFEGAMEVLRGAKVGEPAGVTDSVTTASSAAVPTAATAAMPTSVVAEPATAMEAPDEEFEAAWPRLARSLSGPKPKTVKALAGELGVPEPRVRSWLATAEAAGRVRRRENSRSWELIEPTLF